MKHEFWQEKWEANELGFHRDSVHPLLEEYWAKLSLSENSRVLVPLCGKSNDLLWLKQAGCYVVGAELSQIAVESFFSENNISAAQSEEGDFAHYSADQIELFCGDFFKLEQNTIGDINGIFDRAALVALPPEMRLDYVTKLRKLTEPGVQILLVTVNYEAGQINPPPFTVTDEEVRQLYDEWCDIEILGQAEAELKNIMVLEVAYQLTVK